MENIDFTECKFVVENMRFLTYYDFCDNRKEIKKMFKDLTKNAKLFYKYYVYANVHMSETFKNAIWDFLNGYDKEGFELMRLKRFYKCK